jgi:hypothetical protein
MPSHDDARDGAVERPALDRRSFLRLAAIGAASTVGAALGLPRAAEAGRGGGVGLRSLSFGNALTLDGPRGLTWGVKTSSAKVGPGPNVFSDAPSDVWVDGAGLHLSITKYGGQWRCTEVVGVDSLGYGRYRWTVASNVSNLDPSVVLGLFTWNDAPDYNHREIDIEFAKWSDLSSGTDAQYTVQPWDGAGHRFLFDHQATSPTTHEFTWRPASVEFKSSSRLEPWVYSGAGIPVPGGENPRTNFWLFRGKPPTSGKRLEVVLSDFTFTPLPLVP